MIEESFMQLAFKVLDLSYDWSWYIQNKDINFALYEKRNL